MMRQANNKNKLKHEIHEQANETHRKKTHTHHANQNENNSGAKGKTNEKHSLCKYSTLTHCNECL